jgi:ABC-type multidrug transport system ATPase subunit
MLVASALRRIHIGPLDLTVEPGTCVAVMGPSGAGKSVLLRMIADLDPHEGEVTLDGVRCAAMPAPQWRRHVTYVPADSGWWAPTVAEHFDASIDLPALLPTLGIAADAGSWAVSRLSTGERQRLALLRALRPETRVLLLDEPTSGLDQVSVERIESLLRERMQGGLGILMVTHDVVQAERLASHRLVLEAGRWRAER